MRGSAQGGQTTIEYILLLVVVVALIGGVIWQFNDAFRKWGNNYFGNYIACLLETGELPSLGSKTAGPSASECDQQFEDFSLANGRPLIAGGIGSNNSNPSSNRSPSASPRSKQSGSAHRSSARATDGPHNNTSSKNKQGFVASNSRGSQGGGSRGRRGLGASSPSSQQDESGSGQAATKPRAASASSNAPRRVASQSRFDRARGVSGGDLDDPQERTGGSQRALAAGTLPPQQKNKLIAVAKRAPKVPELDIQPIGIGGWLRYLLIAAILIVLLLILGGQAMRLQKSLEGEN